jgi:predicted acyl esterase
MPVSSNINIDYGPSHNLRLIRARAPMRDGIHLNVAVYLPRNASGPIPAVMELTPYTIDHTHGEGQYFPKRGLAYVVADVRGRGDSEGEINPFLGDALDGFDLVDWISKQDWNDGRVVLFGGSYTGENQWQILGQKHPAVVAASPAAAFAPGIDIPRGGIPNLYQARWLGMVWGKAAYHQSGADYGLWTQEIREAIVAGRPIWTAGETFGVSFNASLRRFMETPGVENWFDMYSSDEQLQDLDVPIFTITGTHDDCMPGTIHHWQRFEQLASNSALAKSHLLIGPWDHAGTDSGENSVGELQFAEAAKLSMRALRADWFRHILFGEEKPKLLSDRFVYYVAGAEEWRTNTSLERATKDSLNLNLHSLPGKNDVFHSGWLTSDELDGPDYVITLNPKDSRALDLEMIPRPVANVDNPLFAPTYNSLLLTQAGNDPTNQIFTVSVNGNGLVYHSDPFEEPLTIVGKPKLSLEIIPDQPEADLSVLLHEIRPDGSSIFLSSELARLGRFNTTAQGTLLVGERNVIVLDDFRFCSRTIGQGSRLRLTVRSPWSALIIPNGDGLLDHPEVNLRVLHSKDSPTKLIMPLGE